MPRSRRTPRAGDPRTIRVSLHRANGRISPARRKCPTMCPGLLFDRIDQRGPYRVPKRASVPTVVEKLFEIPGYRTATSNFRRAADARSARSVWTERIMPSGLHGVDDILRVRTAPRIVIDLRRRSNSASLCARPSETAAACPSSTPAVSAAPYRVAGLRELERASNDDVTAAGSSNVR